MLVSFFDVLLSYAKLPSIDLCARINALLEVHIQIKRYSNVIAHCLVSGARATLVPDFFGIDCGRRRCTCSKSYVVDCIISICVLLCACRSRE